MLSGMTPEEMDKVEAAYRVKWERVGLYLQHAVIALAAIQGQELSEADTAYLRRLDFESEG